MNTAGELAQVRVRAAFVFAVAAYDIVRAILREGRVDDKKPRLPSFCANAVTCSAAC